MQLDVTLCGHRSEWRFPGSSTLANWLQEEPWLRLGGVAVVRLADMRQMPYIARQVRQRVRAIDDGRTDSFEFIDVSLASPSPGLFGVLARRLGFSQSSDTRQQIEQLLDYCRCTTLVITCEAAQGVLDLGDEALDLCELVAKRGRSGFLTVLLGTTAKPSPYVTGFDFSVGAPVDRACDCLDAPEPVLWALYAHIRVAWEVGGNLSQAIEWSQEFQGKLRDADDNRLECLLNTIASRAWGALGAEIKQAVYRFLLTDGDPKIASSAAHADVCRRLEEAGLLSHPLGRVRQRLVPWVCRALLQKKLQKNSLHKQSPLDLNTPLLRNAVYCAPLAQDIFSRCLELEALTASRLRQSGRAIRPRADWENLFEAFRNGFDSSAHSFYPVDCPALPDDAFAFAPLGQLLEDFYQDQPQPSPLRQLTLVRNSVAHGHYAGWQMLKTLQQVCRECAAGPVID